MEQKKPRKPHFISLVKRGLYAVGCTGATAVLYKDDVEIARFKDLAPYSDQAAISPKEDLFVIRSAVGEMAVYSTEPPRLLKKIRFSEIEGQDQGYCFSPDGKYFLSIECQEHPLKTVLSIYETANFTLAGRLFDDDDRLFLEEIEYDEDKENYILLCYFRVCRGEEYVGNKYRLVRFSGAGVGEIKPITEELHDEILRKKCAQRAGVPEE